MKAGEDDRAGKPMSRRTVLALTALLLLAPAASAAQSVRVDEALAPTLLALEEAFAADGGRGPLEGPVAAAGAAALRLVRDLTAGTSVGTRDGELGTWVGTPDRVGVEAGGSGGEDVVLPSRPVEAGGRAYEIATPSGGRTVRTPDVEVPALTLVLQEQRVGVDLPAVEAPGLVVATPPLAFATPAATSPRVEADRPGLSVPEARQEVDLDALDLNVQEVEGTLEVGPHAVPYHAGPFEVGEDRVPEEVPRRWDLQVERQEVLAPETVLLQEGGETVPEQRAEAPGREVPVREEGPLVEARHVEVLRVPEVRDGTPGFGVPAQERRVEAVEQRVATPELPGVATEVPEVVVLEDRPDLPWVGRQEDPFGAVDDLGYVGVGAVDEHGVYPFACTGVAGCFAIAPVVSPSLGETDAALDRTAAFVDGDLLLRLG